MPSLDSLPDSGIHKKTLFGIDENGINAQFEQLQSFGHEEIAEKEYIQSAKPRKRVQDCRCPAFQPSFATRRAVRISLLHPAYNAN